MNDVAGMLQRYKATVRFFYRTTLKRSYGIFLVEISMPPSRPRGETFIAQQERFPFPRTLNGDSAQQASTCMQDGGINTGHLFMRFWTGIRLSNLLRIRLRLIFHNNQGLKRELLHFYNHVENRFHDSESSFEELRFASGISDQDTGRPPK